MTVDGVRPDDAAEVVDARGIRGHGAGKTDFHEIKGWLGLSKCAAQSNAHHQKTSNLTVHGRPHEGCCRRPAALRGTLSIDAVTWFRGIRIKQQKGEPKPEFTIPIKRPAYELLPFSRRRVSILALTLEAHALSFLSARDRSRSGRGTNQTRPAAELIAT